MKSIYLFNDSVTSDQNGIGTFLREAIRCFLALDTSVTVFDFNAHTEEFRIADSDGVRRWAFPKLGEKPFVEESRTIDRLLKLYLSDSEDNVFVVNHSPCDLLVVQLKESFPLSKTVFVIHDQGWTRYTLGDADLFKRIVRNRHHKRTMEKYGSMLRYFDQECLMYQTFDIVVCLSESTQELLPEVYGVDNRKVHLIPNGLSDSFSPITKRQKEKLKRRMHLEPGEKIMLFVGRPTKEKGVERAIRLLDRVLRYDPSMRLVVVGPIFNFEHQFLSLRHIFPKVTFMGHQSAKEVEQWYRVSDMGILPSYYEQCSYVAIEMMMHCMPIVASNACGLRGMFTHDVDAKIAAQEHTDRVCIVHMARSVIELLQYPQQAERIAFKARARYYFQYTFECMCERYGILLNNL